jgi:predicted acetyltransferase
VRDARSSESDRVWMAGVYREYLDDLAALSTGLFPILGEIGHREPDQVARWFGDRHTVPLVILKADERVGFALIGSRAGAPDRPPTYRMIEFFIARASRRRGIGRTAVDLILNRFAGHWEITEYLRNPTAVSFWRRVVASYTRGRYEERVSNGEVRQSFDSRIDRIR